MEEIKQTIKKVNKYFDSLLDGIFGSKNKKEKMNEFLEGDIEITLDNSKRKLEIPENVKEIMEKLLLNNFECYIIGGAIRDYLLGIKPHDYDIFTNATGEEILKVFPRGRILGGEDRQKKILTVIVDGVEVSQYRSNGDRTETGTDFEKHIHTCDLTINSLAYNICGEIIDLVGGSSDLENKIIRFVGDGNDRIKEDPLRIMRVNRFTCKYNFEIDSNSLSSIRENISLLESLPGERILEELEKIMEYSNAINKFKETETLYQLFPEFENVICMDGGDKHNEYVEQHLIKAFKTACSITDDFKLRIAALFHDIGKGTTKETYFEAVEIQEVSTVNSKTIRSELEVEMGFTGTPKTTFYGHEKEGEKIFLKYAKKYKFSINDTKFIAFLIRYHMYGYHSLEEINNNTLVKFFNKMESAGVGILDFVTMLYCDNQGNLAKPRIKFKDFLEDNFFYNKYHNLKNTHPFSVRDLEINGNDLIKLDYKGKDIGIKLNELFNLVLDGKLVNRRDRLMERLLK